MKIAFIVQGLFEKSDSIGYDCIYQYRYMSSIFNKPDDNVCIFAERSSKEYYPDIPIGSLKDFYIWCRKNKDGVIIYHYCDSWEEIDKFLIERTQKSIIRWHNNTPPWFYFSENHGLFHTLDGFNNIVKFTQTPHIVFWVNSEFTQKQFNALGGRLDQVSIVYPASRYLEKSSINSIKRHKFADNGSINLLFVGRVVSHKGHKSIIAVAKRLHVLTRKEVFVRFAGREDVIKKDIELYGADIPGVDVQFYGEVSEETLNNLYNISDVFVCLSEHEGFGLPVFEAMRCRLPVVCWSITALNELMKGHPFAFSYYDLNMFAAAIVSLHDEAIYDRILNKQESILKKYSKDIVFKQIEMSFDYAINNGKYNLHELLPDTLYNNPFLKKIINDNLNKIPNHDFSVRIHDSNPNLFSRYDVIIFRHLFKQLERIKRSKFEYIEHKGIFTIPGEKFHHHNGSIIDDGLYFPYALYKSGHLFFGPYYKLSKGNYIVEFDMYIYKCNVKYFYIDVFTQKNGTIKKLKIRITKLPFCGAQIQFKITDETAPVEFRLSFKKACMTEILFKSIKLRRKQSYFKNLFGN